ncbi:hypothetical protein W02_01870 [Nitrospira sp. KM1]|uniref:hypothetical protein n=1 Tax=Nitrospira sp. KM1 TaxID=1936990 RepID=UPI0013A73AC1|nr:hypothetical protein [Nitrospira sp. KM1]BCA53047.1 hypothetical protein W02_01870 [Nitrospira sp. KM1]
MNRQKTGIRWASAWHTVVAVSFLCAGCMLEQEISRTPRTAVEQLLLTEAVEMALKNVALSLPDRSRLVIDVTGLHTDRALITQPGTGINLTTTNQQVLQGGSLDLVFIRDAVSTALSKQGYRIHGFAPVDTEPDYVARIFVESWGTMQGVTFFGMPPVQSLLIPFSLPELTLYKYQHQRGYGRLHIDFFNYKDGQYVDSTSTIIGRTFYDQYTVLFFITWVKTDLTVPP